MLLNTNTINFEELRSETQRSDRDNFEDRVKQYQQCSPPKKARIVDITQEDVSFDIAKIHQNK